jgi:Spy/CpxP family protein refolding chaperone
MKFKQLMMAAAASVALGMSGMAVAQPRGGEFHHGGGMEFLHGLSLTDAQKAQLKAIHQAGWKQMKPIMEQMRALHEQMVNRMLAAGEVTTEALSPLVQQEESLRNQMDAIHLSQTLQMRALLTPEQLAQAASTHAKLETLHQQEHAVMAGEEGPE